MSPSQPAFVYTTHTIPDVGDVIFVTDGRDTGEYAATIRGSWTPSPTLRYCIETLDPTDQFVDVGANIGEFALPIGKLGVTTLAIEALTENIALLTDGVGRNRISSVHMVHGAAGDTTGKAFVIGHSAWRHVLSDDPGSHPASEINAYRLDDLLSQHGFERPRIIKIDVEGSEQRVLRGMPRALADPQVELIIESNSWMCNSLGYSYHDLLLELERAGFSLYLFHQQILVPRSSHDLQEACVADYLATRRTLEKEVGSFAVRPLSSEESVAILTRDALYADESEFGPAIRWHLDRYLEDAPPVIRAHPAIRALARPPSIIGDDAVDRLRVGWVVHQYGLEVGGGSETLCRTIAELLADHVDSTVLTTTARDFDPWEGFYPEGEETLNGVRVLRFPADQAPAAELRTLYEDAHAHPEDPARGRRWLEALGPRAPGLIDHLRDHAHEYDLLCVMPYVFATTLAALESFNGPRVLVPCAHDEPAFGLDVYREVFELSDGFAFNTAEEAALVEERFGTNGKPSRTIGFPVRSAPITDPNTFRSQFGIEGPYLLCIGRIDISKGTDLVLDIHERTLGETPDHTLVLVGQQIMDVLPQPGVLLAGYVDDQAKASAIAGATAVVLPSPYESLSIVALEAWAQGKPVLVNANSPVLLGQVRRSRGGLWYWDEHDYQMMVRLLLELPDLGQGLGQAGRRWTTETYGDARISLAWLDLATSVQSGDARSEACARAPLGCWPDDG